MNQASTFAESIDTQLSRWLGAIPILMPILQRLNVVPIINRYCPSNADVNEGTTALVMVLNRLMSPSPLYKVTDWMNQTILNETLGISADKFHDRRLGDCLDNIHANADNIWKDIVHHATQEYDISLGFIHYDITSLYFEGVYEDADLLDYGYSRDKKPECKQVNLRLNITDEDGIPLAFKVIKGDTADRTTPIENMKALRELLDEMPNSHDTIVISDQAMLDKDVIIQYHQQDIGYLGPLPAGKEYEQVLMSVPLSELKKHPLNYRPVNQKAEEPEIYYGVLSKVSISGKKVAGTVEPQVLILYSTNKAKLDADKRTTVLGRYLDSLEKTYHRLNQRKYKKKAYTQSQIDKARSKYASVRHLVDIQFSGTDGELALSFKVNAVELEHAKELDGRYLLATNRALSEEEMLYHFKRQDKIEKHVHVIKGPIRIRPMFLHNQERIESLVFICMVALLVYSILEMLSKRANIVMTGENILKQFQTPVVIYTIFKDGSVMKQVSPLNVFQNKFIQSLDFPDPKVYLNRVKLE